MLTKIVPAGTKPKKPQEEKKAQYDPEGYWDLSRKTLLADPNGLLVELKTYDKDNIPDELIEKVKPQMELPEMAEKKVESASLALVAVRIWIVAMIKYH
jgi:dynein heavy chain